MRTEGITDYSSEEGHEGKTVDNIIPFPKKVPAEIQLPKPGSPEETIAILHSMGYESYDAAHAGLEELREQKDAALSNITARIGYTFNIGKNTTEVLKLEQQISKLASLVKMYPKENAAHGDREEPEVFKKAA